MPPESHEHPASGAAIQSTEPARDTAPNRRSRRWVRRLVSAGLVVAALFTAAIFYLRTEDALQRFYIPFAERIGDAEIEARGMTHAFPLSLSLERLDVHHRPSGARLHIDELQTRWDLTSLLNRSMPRLSLLQAVTLRVSLPVELEEEAPPREEPSALTRETPWIPIRIDTAAIGTVEMQILDRDQPWFVARLASLELFNLSPGETARLATSLDVEFLPPASGRRFQAGGELDAELRQPEDGKALAWIIDWPVDVGEAGTPAGEQGPLEFSVIQRLEGSLNPEAGSEHAMQSTATRQGEPAGTVSVQLRIGEPSSNKRRSILLEATGDSLQPALINPILAALGPESLSTGSVDGHLHLQLETGEMEIDSRLRGENLRLAAGPDHGETPPISIDLTQEALFHGERRRLLIERTSLSVKEGGAQRIEARLTAPFEFFFEDETTTPSLARTDSGAPQSTATTEPSRATETSSPARLELSIDRVELDRLKPWTAVWNAEWLGAASGGTVSANMSAEVADSARSVSLRGRMEVEDLLWSGGFEGPMLGPLGIATDLETHSPDLSRFAISRFTATFRNASGDLAQLDADGSFNRKEESFSGRAAARFPDLPRGLEATGRIPSDSPVSLEGGSAELRLSAERLSKTEPIRIKGGGEVRKATLAVEGNRLVRSAGMEFMGFVPPGGSRIEAITMNTRVTDDGGADAGSVKVEGYWPLRFEERENEAGGIDPAQSALPVSPVTGKLGIRARDFDLKPWFELFGLRLEDEDGPAWPASADLTLTVDPLGEVFTLEGEERLGPVAPKSGTTAEAAQTSPQP